MSKALNISVNFIRQLKQQIISSRYVIAKIANAESLRLYFAIGKAVDEQFKKQQWGAKVLDAVSERLQKELPGLRGFSGSNMRKMRAFYDYWNQDNIICPLLTDKLAKDEKVFLPSLTDKSKTAQNRISSTVTTKLENTDIESFLSISFSHHYEIIIRIKENEDTWYYINRVANEFWSVRHLKTELKNSSHLQTEKLPNNFKQTLTSSLANKAIRAFKDQYLLEFINLEDSDEEIDERVLEHEIVQNIKNFIMSLGSDFSFMGNQYRLTVDEDEYFIDLLFFHRGLQALVAFELKKGKFKPEYVGKMNFYLSALDDLIKQPHENPSIGIILCKEKKNKKVEYSFRDINKPMGVAVFKTSETLPKKYQKALPSPEELKQLLD